MKRLRCLPLNLEAKLTLNTSKDWANKSAAKILWVHFLQGNLENGILLLWILVPLFTPQHLFEIWSRQLLFWLGLRWWKHRTNRLLYVRFISAMNIFVNSLAYKTWWLFSARSPQHYQGIGLFMNSGSEAWGDHVKTCLFSISLHFSRSREHMSSSRIFLSV